VGLTVYFMFVNGNATDVDAAASYPIDVDMVGPLAPLDLTAGIGDTLLLLTWTPQTDSTIQGFNIYVEDQGAIGADGSTEAGGSSPTDCTSDVLVDSFTTTVTSGGGSSDGGTVVVGVPDGGVSGSEAVGISEIDGGYLAGSIAGGTSTSYTLSTLPDGRPLVDGHQYAVAVAAFDDTGNVGLVSNLACQAPAAVVDFFNAYGSAGGGAGGGFCSLQAPGAPAFGSALGTVLGVAAVAFVRRRRRRR
jgi:hypothetical protein